ncbi:CLUMA_CG003817, isoform A [Clunio marinus]|uniref:CLUMA_CG003817, isoform A n=1 Tax=Clunio marinus TaxID=568069 RepID=A0A1J1HQ43_9DIPT|nr:CLUMA_CG003817, isoform A [Clunio marinus]
MKVLGLSLLFFGFLHINALILECNFSTVTWSLIGSVYTCTGAIQNITDNRNISDVIGNHTADFNNSNVQAVAIAAQNLSNGIPLNFDMFFPNLTVLSFSNVGLTSVSRSDISPYLSLQLLILFNNQLESLEGDLFSDTPMLQYINLNSNRIRHLGPNIFAPLVNLRTLRMQNNVCINDYVDNNTTGISSLQWEASFRCPSSFEQLEQNILNGENFGNIINQLFDQISILEERVSQLENRNMTMVE